MTRAGWNGLTTKSFAPSLIASRTFDSWPRAEHMTTFADGSAATISPSAARPSFSGIVMSRVIRSGFSAWYCEIASTPLPASPTTSWPPLARASLTILRMNAASSTTSTRAIEIRFLPSELRGWGFRVRERGPVIGRGPAVLRRRRLRGRRLAPDERLDLDRPLAGLGYDEVAGGEAQAVDEEVDRLVRVAVELDEAAGRHPDEVADRHVAPAELGPDAHVNAAQRLVEARHAVGVGRAPVAEVLGAELVERLGHAHHERVRDELDQAARLAEDGEDAARDVGRVVVALEGALERREHARVGRGDLDLGAEDGARRVRGGGHHLVHRLADGRELELGELGRLVLGRLLAHHGRGERAGALERHDEDVAAGDAVDVGDAGGHRGRRKGLQRVAAGRHDRDRARLGGGAGEPLHDPGDRLGGRLAEPDQGLVDVHRPSSTGPSTCAARLRPLRPGRARWTGTWSAYSVMPLAAWPSRRTTSPGLSPRTSSTFMRASATSARIVISTPRRAASTASAASSEPEAPAPSRCEKAAATGAIAQYGTSSDSVDDVRAMRASIVSDSVGSLNGAICAFSVLPSSAARLSSTSATSCQISDSWLSIVPNSRRESAQSISVRRRSLGAWSGAAPRSASSAQSTNDSSALMRRRVSIGLTSRTAQTELDGSWDCAVENVSWLEEMTSSSMGTRSSADRRVEAVRQKLSSERLRRRSWSLVNFVGRAKLTVRRRGERRCDWAGVSSCSSPCLAASTRAAICSGVSDSLTHELLA